MSRVPQAVIASIAADRWEQVAGDRLRMIERLVARIEDVDSEYARALRGSRLADPQVAGCRCSSSTHVCM